MTYLEAEKAVEFEADGTIHRLGIYEPLELVSREEWEASLPPHILEEAVQAAQDMKKRASIALDKAKATAKGQSQGSRQGSDQESQGSENSHQG